MLSPWDSFKKMYEYTTQEVVLRMNMAMVIMGFPWWRYPAGDRGSSFSRISSMWLHRLPRVWIRANSLKCGEIINFFLLFSPFLENFKLL